MVQELINVFVSHYHNDEEHIGKMKELLGDEFNIRNYSVTSDKLIMHKAKIISNRCCVHLSNRQGLSSVS